VWHPTVSVPQGTAWSRLHTSAAPVARVVTLRAHGGPLQALVAAGGLDERTGAAGWARAGRQGQAVHEYGVEPPRDWGQGPADARRGKQQGGLVGLALAMTVKTRLWRGGARRAPRDLPLIRRLLARVKRCAARRPLLVCMAGLGAYVGAIRAPWRAPGSTG
jgi:hypothetical protein